jgi:hypothetical protein
MDVTIVADEGSHVLIAHGDRYAVVERRAGHFYNCHDEKRGAAADLSAIGDVLDDSDWTDEGAAQATFNDVIDRGKELAQRML